MKLIKIVWSKGGMVLAAVGIVFGIISGLWLDPDLGIHAQSGRMIRESGQVPRLDTYSFTRTNYPWYYHEWLASVLTSLMLERIGFGGTAWIFGGLAAVSLGAGGWGISGGLARREKYAERLRAAVAVCGAMVLLAYIGVRMQVFTWMFLAVELWILRKLQGERKWGWAAALVALITVWSNLHGGWVLGMGVAAGAIAGMRFRWGREKEWPGWAVAGIVAGAVILGLGIFNPYGVEVVREIGATLGDANLRWKISEWMPMSRFDATYIFFTALSLSMAWVYRKRLEDWEVIGVAVIFVAGMMSNRHVPLLVIFSLPVLYRCIGWLAREAGSEAVLGKAARWLVIMVVAMSAVNIWLVGSGVRILAEENFYPVAAVAYLKSRQDLPNAFNYYGWGGYLIWKMPGARWFIDGRMPSWEGILSEYEAVEKGEKEGEAVLDKYGVKMVIWPARQLLGGEPAMRRLVGKLMKLLRKDDPGYRGIEGLMREGGWRVVYEDGTAKIWERD